MDETRVNWWMDDTSRWHRGYPPAGWRQAADLRWHPPRDDDEPTDEMEQTPPDGVPRHAQGTGSHASARGWRGPRWALVAVLASVAALAVVVIAVAAITDGSGRDDRVTATANVPTTLTPTTAPFTPTAPPGSSSSVAGDPTDPPAPPTTARATTSTTSLPTSAPATTSPPPTDPPVQLSAPCSPEGATAVSADGVPLTCTTQKCHGAPFDSPRWRRTAC
jgi:hypothetical protein